MKEFNTSLYTEALAFAADLKSCDSLDLVSVRNIVRDLIAEEKKDWVPVLLDETRGSYICDLFLEAAIFEFPISLTGAAGLVKMVLEAANKTVEIVSFQILPHKEGLFISKKSAQATEFSEEVRNKCFDQLLECISELPPAKAKLREGYLKVEDESLAFLNDLVIGNAATSLEGMLELLRTDHEMTLTFSKSYGGVLIKAMFKEQEEKIASEKSWEKIKEITGAGPGTYLALSGTIAPPTVESTQKQTKKRSEEVLRAEAGLKNELLFIAQSFEYLRSIEVSAIHTGLGNAGTINLSMKIVDRVQQALSAIQNSDVGVEWVESEVKTVISMMMSNKISSKLTLSKRQIEQIDLKKRRLSGAFLTYRDALLNPAVPKLEV